MHRLITQHREQILVLVRRWGIGNIPVFACMTRSHADGFGDMDLPVVNGGDVP